MENLQEEIADCRKEIEALRSDINILLKINSIDQPKTKLDKLDVMEKFYNTMIVKSSGNRINTAHVFKKINEFGEKFNCIFTKFEVANFMQRKGNNRFKIGSNNYYLDLKMDLPDSLMK